MHTLRSGSISPDRADKDFPSCNLVANLEFEIGDFLPFRYLNDLSVLVILGAREETRPIWHVHVGWITWLKGDNIPSGANIPENELASFIISKKQCDLMGVFVGISSFRSIVRSEKGAPCRRGHLSVGQEPTGDFTACVGTEVNLLALASTESNRDRFVVQIRREILNCDFVLTGGSEDSAVRLYSA